MFVVMALVTTVATTPLTKALYPPWYQKKVEKWRRGEIDWDGNPTNPSEADQPQQKSADSQVRRLMVHLRLDSLPSLFTFITLLSPESVPTSAHPDTSEESSQSKEVQIRKRPLEVHGLRVIELTDRTSSVMHLTEGDDSYSLRDPVVNAFRTFSQLHDVAVSGRVAVVPADSYAETIMTQASEVSSDFALIPWGEYGSTSEDMSLPIAMSGSERFRSTSHFEFISQTLQQAAHTCNTGIFIDNGFGGITKPVDRPDLARTKSAMSIRSYRPEFATFPVANKSHHIFLPFFGGPDDHVALRIVLQLAKNQHVTASIVRITGPAATTTKAEPTTSNDTSTSTASTPSPKSTAVALQDSAARQTQQDAVFFATMQASLPSNLAPRVVFSEVELSGTTPTSSLPEIVVLAQKAVGQRPKNAGDVVVVGRRNARFGDALAAASSSSAADGQDAGAGTGSASAGVDLRKTIGAVAEQLVTVGVKASILVVQAGGKGLEAVNA
jgi:hypothetical protein